MNDKARPRSLAERLRSLLLAARERTTTLRVPGWKPQDAQRVVRARDLAKAGQPKQQDP